MVGGGEVIKGSLQKHLKIEGEGVVDGERGSSEGWGGG